MKNLFLPIILFLFIVSINAQSDGSQLLNSLQSKFQDINDLSADITQLSGGQSLSGKLFFKKENSFRFELKDNIIISNGSNVWNYNKKENKVIIDLYDDNDPSAFSINKIIYDYPSKSILTTESDASGDILVLNPRTNTDLAFNVAKIWVNKDNLISKILIESPSWKSEIRFSNYKLNQNLPEANFIFSPPQGSTIIDLR